MSDTLVLRTATAGDAVAIATVIAASFEQYRGRLVPESGAFRETPDNIAAELERGVGALVQFGGYAVGGFPEGAGLRDQLAAILREGSGDGGGDGGSIADGGRARDWTVAHALFLA